MKAEPVLFTIIIIVFSAALFLYWFRYICLLILREQGSELVTPAAGGVRLRYLEVQQQLASEPPPVSLDPLHRELENDYHVLAQLLRTGATANPLMTRVLRLDFLMMRAWYRLMRPVDRQRAGMALSEMSSIVGYLAAEV